MAANRCLLDMTLLEGEMVWQQPGINFGSCNMRQHVDFHFSFVALPLSCVETKVLTAMTSSQHNASIGLEGPLYCLSYIILLVKHRIAMHVLVLLSVLVQTVVNLWTLQV